MPWGLSASIPSAHQLNVCPLGLVNMKEANGGIFYLPMFDDKIENLFLIWNIDMLVCVLGSFLDLRGYLCDIFVN